MAKTTKRRQFTVDVALLNGLGRLSEQSGESADSLVEQALRDILKKHRVPVSFEDALRQSARQTAANDREPKPSKHKMKRE